MLQSLHIENVAVIKCLNVDFSNGFSVLTGETGAGKSIIIDSISLILGAKADRELIRNGEKTATVFATFTDLSDDAVAYLSDLGLLSEDGDERTVLLQRTLSHDGRSSARCSGKPITVSMLREIGERLITIHGQNDTSRLLDKKTHLELLDHYAGLKDTLSDYDAVYRRLCALRSERKAMQRSEAEKERRLEMLAYQIRDIDGGNLKIGEEELLHQERNQLQYAEKISKNTSFCYRALKASEKGSATLLLEKSESALRALSGILSETEALIGRLETCRYEIEDIAESIQLLGAVEYDDPATELDRVESRLDTIRRLEKKYGTTVEEVLAFREQAAEELEKMENQSALLEEIEREEAVMTENARALSDQLHDLRLAAAERLNGEIISVLSFLDMPKVHFSVKITDTAEFTPNGRDSVEFLISTNPNEPPAPLIKIASGGELSRIMLAIRSVFSDKASVGTLIFDEIDTGISGRTSQKVGMKLKRLADHTEQVLCITHSPQIAALATQHYKIRKQEVGGRNETSLLLLDETGRIDEISRILGGIEITDTQRKSAQELIQDGKKY